MTNKSIEEQIKEMLLNNKEWNAFDDGVEDNYVSIEYHKETLDEVIKQILSLIKKSKIIDILEGLKESAWEWRFEEYKEPIDSIISDIDSLIKELK